MRSSSEHKATGQREVAKLSHTLTGQGTTCKSSEALDEVYR